MIPLLSSIGRFSVVLASAMTMIGATVFGYFYVRAQEYGAYGQFTISGGGSITPFEVFGALIGCGLGLVFAGSVFGTIAAIYDIQDSLKVLVVQGKALPPQLDGAERSQLSRREPRL